MRKIKYKNKIKKRHQVLRVCVPRRLRHKINKVSPNFYETIDLSIDIIANYCAIHYQYICVLRAAAALADVPHSLYVLFQYYIRIRNFCFVLLSATLAQTFGHANSIKAKLVIFTFDFFCFGSFSLKICNTPHSRRRRLIPPTLLSNLHDDGTSI